VSLDLQTPLFAATLGRHSMPDNRIRRRSHVLLLDHRGKLGELEGTGVKLPSRSSIASRPGLLEQPPHLSTHRVENDTAVSRPVPLA